MLYFLLNVFLLDPRNVHFLEKVNSLVRFDYFSSQTWLFGIININFQKDSSKNEVSKSLKYTLPVKILVAALHNTAICRKTELFDIYLDFSSSKAWIFGII